MTEFYKTGTYWPDSSNCEIVDTFDDSSMQGLEVIAISKADAADPHDYEYITPSLTQSDFGFGMVVDEDDDDTEEEEEADHIDIIFEDDHMILEEGDDTSSGSSSDASGTTPPQIVVEDSLVDDSHPRSQIFSDELELLLTNVDGDDCDPDTMVMPEQGSARRRMYRKSMSLPMSPVNMGGSHRERLDSINFSDFLLSPLKLGGLEHHDVDVFEHISPMNDFNLLTFVGGDSVFSPPPSINELPPKTPKVAVTTPAPAQMKKETPAKKAVQKTLAPPAPSQAKKPAMSRGKCIEMMKATHQRQENLVKRCGAIETKKLNAAPRGVVPPPQPPKKKPVMPRKINLDEDPDWSPLQNVLESGPSGTGSKRQAAAPSSLKNHHHQPQSKTVNSNKRTQEQISSGSSTSNGGHVVSNNSNSNLNEIKRKFLANIPVIAPTRPKKALPAKVIRSDVPLLLPPPSDHNYCSPAKRVYQPLAKVNHQQKTQKTAILITDAAPLKSKVKSPKKEAPPRKEEKPVVVAKEEPKKVPVVVVKDEQKNVSAPVEVAVVPPPPSPKPKKKRAINLEDYKKLRSGQSLIVKKEPKAEDSNAQKSDSATGDEKRTTSASSTFSLLLPKDHPNNSADSKDANYLDPISEAKNKALRMAERRKAAARQREEEIQIKAPLVPILPLAVMTGLMSEESYLAELEAAKEKGAGAGVKKSASGVKEKAPFEEIMIVSVGCNTATTIRPDYDSKTLLSDLPSNAPLASNSLLFSIQDAVIKKTGSSVVEDIPSAGEISPGKPEGANVGAGDKQHGENKVIMHLRKDRIRPRTFSVGCQTETTPEFPQLICLKVKAASANKRNYRRRSTSSHSSSSDDESDRSYYSDRSRSPSPARSDRGVEDYSDTEEHEDEFGRSAKRRRLYSNRSRSRSCRRSPSRETSIGRYDSRSRSPRRMDVWSRGAARSSRSRSRSPCYSVASSRPMSRGRNNNNRWPKKNNPSPEERRIVYVGRLETGLTKDELRIKFIGYGAVKLVTLHEKANGTRYGFVTFEEPSEAFKAIESAKDDPKLNMYDIGFGGRRAFCGASYADLDNVETEEDMYGPPPGRSAPQPEESFESLLLSFKRKVAAVEP